MTTAWPGSSPFQQLFDFGSNQLAESTCGEFTDAQGTDPDPSEFQDIVSLLSEHAADLAVASLEEGDLDPCDT